MSLDPSVDPLTLAGLSSEGGRHSAVTTTYTGPIARVSLVDDDPRRFSDETAVLLHERLRSMSFIISIIFSITFAFHLFIKFPFLYLRSILVVMIVGGAVWLRFCETPSLRRLRVFELLYFGVTVAILLLAAAGHLIKAGLHGELVSVLTWKRQLLSSYSGLLLTYAMFIPNTWKRAAAVLLPAVCAVPALPGPPPLL